MAAPRRLSWHILVLKCLMITLIVLFSLNFHLALGIDIDVVNSSMLLSLPESACVLTFSSLNYGRNQKVIDHLADVSFRNEQSVDFGLVDFATFRWPNGDNISYVSGSKNYENVFLLFIKNKIDRTCLLLPSNMKDKLPTEKVYLGPVTVESLVDFLNNNCHTYRHSDGSLTVQGMHRDYILQNLFHVENISNLNMEKLIQILKEDEESKFIEKKAACKDETDLSQTCKQDELKFKLKPKKLFQPEITLPIPQCEKIPLSSTSDFFNEYLSLSRPVIIQGAMDDWAALKKWTNKFLRSKFGDRTVHVKLTPGGEYEGVEEASQWEDVESFEIPPTVRRQLRFPDLVVVRPAPHNVKFSQFMDIVESVSVGMLKNVSAYLEYTSVDQYMPELKKDLKEMPFFKGLLELKHLNIWLSDGNTLGKTHFDPFDNFLCQISGQKQVILYSPHDGHKLYEGHIPEAILSFNNRSYAFRRKKLLDSTSMVMSPVDIVSPDIQRFPLFADAHPLNCTIREGEVLFMPAFWWHEVHSTPSPHARRNLAVNFWYEPFLTKEFPCPECKLDINPKYRHLL